MNYGAGGRRNLSTAQLRALHHVGNAYKEGSINFVTATRLRDLIRQGQISEAYGEVLRAEMGQAK